MLITFPSAITLPSSYSGWVFKAYGSVVKAATFSTSSGKLQIKNIFTQYYMNNTDYYFTVTGFTNPSTSTSFSFTVDTYETTNGNNQIDSFSGFSF